MVDEHSEISSFIRRTGIYNGEQLTEYRKPAFAFENWSHCTAHTSVDVYHKQDLKID